MAKPMRFASKMSLFLILKPAHFSSASMRRGYWKIRAGLLQKNAPLQLPATLGGDFSGVVEAVGPGATDFDMGVAVYGQASPTSGGSGSFADFAIAPARCAAQKPKAQAMPRLPRCLSPGERSLGTIHSFTIYRRSRNPRPSKIAGIAFSIRALRVPDCFALAK
jgi:alcohol dehydrogenase-like protein